MSAEKLEFKINQQRLAGKKIALVRSLFNQDITSQMLSQAEKILKQNNVEYRIYEVPGAFELPYKINRIHKNYDGLVALGCLIKGETMHFEYIAGPVSQALVNLSINLKKPIGFGLATCLTKKQAVARLDLGAQATKTVLQLLSLK